MAVSDVALLARCAEFALAHSRAVHERVAEELQTSAATSLVMTLRLLRLQRAVLATGMLSLFEAMLQRLMGWKKHPFERLARYLERDGHGGLAAEFEDYRLAVNVLKHGRGPSYDKLLERAASLEFRIRLPDEPSFCEGEVSEVDVLVDVDEGFVMRCAALIEEVSALIRSKEDVWI